MAVQANGKNDKDKSGTQGHRASAHTHADSWTRCTAVELMSDGLRFTDTPGVGALASILELSPWSNAQVSLLGNGAKGGEKLSTKLGFIVCVALRCCLC